MSVNESSFSRTFPKDLSAGLVVFLVALPLCLGIALASGAPMSSGLISGIIGGVLVVWVSGSQSSVSGPAAGLTAIVATQIDKLGSFEALLVAVMIAGAIQIAMGGFKLGSIAVFFPSSVIKGLLSAIGIILILKQIPHIFGHDPDYVGDLTFFQGDGENTFSEIFKTFLAIHPGATVIGLFSLILLWNWDRFVGKKVPIPAPLVVVALGIGFEWVFRQAGGSWLIQSSHLVQVPTAGGFQGVRELFLFPDFSQLGNSAVYVAAITVAIVASLETLLNLEAVDKIDPKQRVSPPNRELVAQGVGNLACGALGGLPLTSVIVRSSVNLNYGGQTKLSCFVHGALLIVSVLFLAPMLNLIPLASLAAILLVTGFKLASPELFKNMWREGKFQFLPFLCTILAIVLTDLLIGILVGLIVSVIFILASNLKNPLNWVTERHPGGVSERITLATQVSFLNKASLISTFERIPEGSQLTIDARHTKYIDPDILDLFQDFKTKTAPARSIKLNLIGFQKTYKLEDQFQTVDVVTPETQKSITPDDAFRFLKDGNKRFVEGKQLSRDWPRQIDGTADQQSPLAVVLNCMDSRTSPELIFDQGLGSLFSIRIAGGVAFDKALGSMEFGCSIAGAKLIVVLGHTRCGAIKATAQTLQSDRENPETAGSQISDNLKSITSSLTEAVEKVEKSSKSPCSILDEEFLDQVAKEHTHLTLSRIQKDSPVLNKMIGNGELKIVGGVYDVKTGKVEFFDSE
jgi:MFS superfamily sulfate permease-like transporter